MKTTKKIFNRRKSNRLPNYDYAQAGHYFITICCYKNHCLLGEIQEGEMYLNTVGQLVQQEWEATPEIRPNVELGPYIIMPNHLHAIVHINYQLYDSPRPLGAFQSPSQTLGAIVRGFKGSVVRELRGLVDDYYTYNSTLFQQYQLEQLRAHPTIWAKNYYDHIIRDEKAYQSLQQYIEQNPAKWKKDYLNKIS